MPKDLDGRYLNRHRGRRQPGPGGHRPARSRRVVGYWRDGAQTSRWGALGRVNAARGGEVTHAVWVAGSQQGW